MEMVGLNGDDFLSYRAFDMNQIGVKRQVSSVAT